jgi:hypothetical protein
VSITVTRQIIKVGVNQPIKAKCPIFMLPICKTGWKFTKVALMRSQGAGGVRLFCCFWTEISLLKGTTGLRKLVSDAKVGGIIAIHNSGVREYAEDHNGSRLLALEEIDPPVYTNIPLVESITFARKVATGGSFPR